MIDLDQARRTAQEAEERAERSSALPWVLDEGDPTFPVTMGSGSEERPLHDTWFLDDVRFIVAARTDVPALARLVRDLADEIKIDRAEIEALRKQCSHVGADLVRTEGERDEARGEVERLRASVENLMKIVRAASKYEATRGGSFEEKAALIEMGEALFDTGLDGCHL